MQKDTPVNFKYDVMKMIAMGVFLPVIGSLISVAYLGDWYLSNEPLHTLVEAAGAFMALVIIILINLNKDLFRIQDSAIAWCTCALVSMGLLDIFHAFTSPGNNFVWLHSMATFSGGAFFSMVWLSGKIALPFRCNTVITTFVCLAIAGFSIGYPEMVPAMIDNGNFTIAAKGLNFIGGLGFFAASLWFLKSYKKENDRDSYLLATHCLLFGAAGILFELSTLWDAAWWWWHVLRMAAYGVLAYFFFTVVNTQKVKDGLESSIDIGVFRERAAKICGIITMLLGGSVLAGWVIGNATLVQVHPTFAPMQFNTALGFVFSGFGLTALAFKKAFLRKASGFLVALIATLTLSEYVFAVDLHIDRLFIDPDITTKTSHPGRMAPNTALCFLLTGLALLFWNWNKSIQIAFSASVLFMALLALGGYMIGVEGLYGLGTLTRMAIHTASGFLVLSCGLLLYKAADFQSKPFDLWKLTPSVASTVFIVLTVFFWHSVRESTDLQNNQYFRGLVYDTQDALEDRFHTYELGLKGGQGLFHASLSVERQEWESYVGALEITANLPGINGVGYIDLVRAENLDGYLEVVRGDGVPDFKNHPDTDFDDKFIIKYIVPVEDNKEAIGLDIGFEERRREAAENARDIGLPQLTRKIELVQDSQKTAGFLLLIPLYDTKNVPDSIEDRRAHFQGWVYAPFIGSHFLEDLVEVSRKQVDFAVYDGSEIKDEALIYSSKLSFDEDFSLYQDQTNIMLAGREWTIVWHASPGFTMLTGRNSALFVLAVGGTLTIFLYFMLSQLVRRKEIIAEEVNRQTAVIREHDAEREQWVQELAKSNEDLERFAYVASHDLQEPLRMVKSFTGLLEERYADKLDDTAKQYISFAHGSAGRMQELVNDLLEYSRMGSDAEKLEELDMNEVLGSVLENLQERLDKTDAEITFDELPAVRGNPVRLMRVLQNLIGNGVKYQAEGNVPKIHVGAEKKGNLWLFFVADNGIGISEEYGEKIFEPFKRLHGNDEYSGTGMGLAICKRIIEGYGGTIWVEKNPESQGTIFYFTLPEIIAGQEGANE